MKVKLSSSVNRFGYNGVKYSAEDVFEIEDSAFVPYIMEQIPEPVIVEAPVITVKPKRRVKAVEPTTETAN